MNGPIIGLRGNAWSLNYGSIIGEPRDLSDHDVAQVLAVLIGLNGSIGRRHFQVNEEVAWHLWGLYHHASDVHDLQLRALLRNHHAFVGSAEQGGRFFDHGLDPTVYDRFGVGSTRPNLWVLGERGNPRDRTFPLPFGTTAGRHLVWPHLGQGVRLSNCYQPDEFGPGINRIEHPLVRRRIERDWEGLGRPPILLLGSNAMRLLRGLPAIVGTLDHPQFIWRFHHDQVANWSHDFAVYQDMQI